MVKQIIKCDAHKCDASTSDSESRKGWVSGLKNGVNLTVVLSTPSSTTKGHHFCSMGCLAAWLSEQYAKEQKVNINSFSREVHNGQ